MSSTFASAASTTAMGKSVRFVCELLQAINKEEHCVGPLFDPPTCHDLRRQGMTLFGLTVFPRLAWKRQSSDSEGGAQWIAIETDADLARAFQDTELRPCRGARVPRNSSTLAEESDYGMASHASTTTPEVTILLTSYDAVAGRSAPRSFAQLLEENYQHGRSNAVMSIPLHCPHCYQLKSWTLQLSESICSGIKKSTKASQSSKKQKISKMGAVPAAHLDSDTNPDELHEAMKKHNESCRVTFEKHKDSSSCQNAQHGSGTRASKLNVFRPADSSYLARPTLDTSGHEERATAQAAPEITTGSQECDLESETEMVVVPSVRDCACALTFDSSVSELDALWIEPWRDSYAFENTSTTVSDTMERKYINHSTTLPEDTITARNPSSEDPYNKRLKEQVERYEQALEDYEKSIQELLRKEHAQNLRVRQTANRKLVANLAKERLHTHASASHRLNGATAGSVDVHSAVVPTLKRRRESSSDALEVAHDRDDGQESTAPGPYDDDSADMRDGMQPWKLPRVISLNVPAVARRSRSLKVTAVLVYLDSPYDCANGVQRRDQNAPVRACEFHRIVNVEPDDGRFTRYIGCMFSSLQVSYRLFTSSEPNKGSKGLGGTDAWCAWFDVLTDASLSDLARHGAFLNPPHMDGKPLCRDYCASLCPFECTYDCFSKVGAWHQLSKDSKTHDLDEKFKYSSVINCCHDLTRTYVQNRSPINKDNGYGMPIWEQTTFQQRNRCTTNFWSATAEKHFLCMIGSNPDFVEPKVPFVSDREAWLLRQHLYKFEAILGIASNHNVESESDVRDCSLSSSTTKYLTQWENRTNPLDRPCFKIHASGFPQDQEIQSVLQEFISSQMTSDEDDEDSATDVNDTTTGPGSPTEIASAAVACAPAGSGINSLIWADGAESSNLRKSHSEPGYDYIGYSRSLREKNVHFYHPNHVFIDIDGGSNGTRSTHAIEVKVFDPPEFDAEKGYLAKSSNPPDYSHGQK